MAVHCCHGDSFSDGCAEIKAQLSARSTPPTASSPHQCTLNIQGAGILFRGCALQHVALTLKWNFSSPSTTTTTTNDDDLFVLLEEFSLTGAQSAIKLLQTTQTANGDSSITTPENSPSLEVASPHNKLEVRVGPNVMLDVGGEALVVSPEPSESPTPGGVQNVALRTVGANVSIASGHSAFSILSPTIFNATINAARFTLLQTTILATSSVSAPAAVASFITNDCQSCTIVVQGGASVKSASLGSQAVVAASYMAKLTKYKPSIDSITNAVLKLTDSTLSIESGASVIATSVLSVAVSASVSATTSAQKGNASLTVLGFFLCVGENGDGADGHEMGSRSTTVVAKGRHQISVASVVALGATTTTHASLHNTYIYIVDKPGIPTSLKSETTSIGRGLVAGSWGAFPMKGRGHLHVHDSSIKLHFKNSFASIVTILALQQHATYYGLAVAGASCSSPLYDVEVSGSACGITAHNVSIVVNLHQNATITVVSEATVNAVAIAGIAISHGSTLHSEDYGRLTLLESRVELHLSDPGSGIQVSTATAYSVACGGITTASTIGNTSVLVENATITTQLHNTSAISVAFSYGRGIAVGGVAAGGGSHKSVTQTILRRTVVCTVLKDSSKINLKPGSMQYGVTIGGMATGASAKDTSMIAVNCFLSTSLNTGSTAVVDTGHLIYSAAIGGLTVAALNGAMMRVDSVHIKATVSNDSVARIHSPYYVYGAAVFGVCASHFSGAGQPTLVNRLVIETEMSHRSTIELVTTGDAHKAYLRGATIGGVSIHAVYLKRELVSLEDIKMVNVVTNNVSVDIVSVATPSATALFAVGFFGRYCGHHPLRCTPSANNVSVFSQFANHSSIGVQLSSVVSTVGGIGSEYTANLSCISCHVKLVIIGRSVVAESTATAAGGAAASLGSITTVGSIALYEDSTIVGCTDDASRPISEITATTTTAVPLLPGVNIRTSTNAGSELCAKLVATFHSGLLSAHATCNHRHMHEWEEPATLSLTLPLAPATATATVFSTVSDTPSSSPTKSSILSWSLSPSSQQPPENVEPLSSSTTLVGSLSPSATKRIATPSVSWTEVRTTPPSPQPQTPSSPPTQIPRKVTVRVKPNMGLSEEERVATVGVGVSAASFVSPTTATGIGKLGALSQLVECSLLDDDFTPDPVEHPLSPAIGSTKYNRLAGAALCSTLIVVVPTLVASLLNRQRNPSSSSTPHHRYTVNVVKILGVVHVATFGYFLPNVMNVVATIFMHCTGFVERAVACVSIACCTAIFILRCLTVHVFLYDAVEVSRRTQNNNNNTTTDGDGGKSSSEDTSNLSIISDESQSSESSSSNSDEEDEEESSSSSDRQHGSSLQRALSNGRITSWNDLRPRVAFPFFIDLYGSFFDGAEPKRLKMESHNAQTKSCGLGFAQSERARRSYVFVDVGVTSCGTFLSGLRPTADRGCLYLAWTLGFLGLTHLLYLSILRPARTRLETVSMITMAISNVVSAAACIAALTQDDQPTTRWTDIVNFCLTFQLLHYFAASLIQGVWALVRAERRKAVLLMKYSKNEDHSDIVSSDDTTAVGGNHGDHDDYEQPPPLLVLYSSDEEEEDVFTQGHQRPLLLRPSASGGRVEVEMKNHVVEPKATLGGYGHVSNPLR